MLQVIRVSTRDTLNYPFKKTIYENPFVLYHGTSSNYSAIIESKGFLIGDLPFSTDLLRRLIIICDNCGYKSWSYTCVKGFSKDTSLENEKVRSIYLSANFWYARDYATNIGGEAIHNALALCNELLNNEINKAHIEKDEFDQIRNILYAIKHLTSSAFPVVYAVQIQPEWLRNPKVLEREDDGDYTTPGVNIPCIKSIPVNNLIAKVEYMNGVEPGYLRPHPKYWQKAVKGEFF